MKRNMDLVRAILLAMDQHEHGFAPPHFTIAGYDQEVIGHHVWLMAQGQLITAAVNTAMSDPSPTAIPLTITWAGHDFLDAVGNDTVWTKVKTHLKDRGITVPFAVLQELAVQALKTLAGL